MDQTSTVTPGAANEAANLPEPSTLRGTQAKRRQRIIDEAHRMIVESGDANVQIRDIAERADVALGTAYRYFGSKERLYAEVWHQWCLRCNDEITLGLRGVKTNTDRTRLLAKTTFERFIREPQLLAIGPKLRVTDDPAILRIVDRTEEGMLELFRNALCGVEHRDADSIALIVMAVVRAALEGHSAGSVSVDEAHRRIAKAVKMVLE